MCRYEKKAKKELDHDIKLAGLEAVVKEEHERHPTVNDNRFRTFEQARLEDVKAKRLETKFRGKVSLRGPGDPPKNRKNENSFFDPFSFG